MKNRLFKDITQNTISKVIEISNPDDFNIKETKKGILSLHAKWSAHSFTIGNSILKLIDKYNTDNFQIIIIDINTISVKKQCELFGDICHGYFESLWIENGKIEFNYRDNNNISEIIKFKEFITKKINKNECKI